MRTVRVGFGGALWDRADFAAQRFNKPQEAITIGLELQAYTREGMAQNPENKVLPAAYASGLAVLAVAYQAVGEQEKAVQVSEEAEAFFEKALKEDPGNLSLLRDAAEAARNLSYRVSSISQKRSRDAELVARERYRPLDHARSRQCRLALQLRHDTHDGVLLPGRRWADRSRPPGAQEI